MAPLGADISCIYGCEDQRDTQRNSQLPLCSCFITPSFQLREQRKCLAKLYMVKHTFWVFLEHCLDKDTSFLSPFGDMVCSGIYLSAILTMHLLYLGHHCQCPRTCNQHTKKLQHWSEHLSSGSANVCKGTSPTGRCVFCTTWESHSHRGAQELSVLHYF